MQDLINFGLILFVTCTIVLIITIVIVTYIKLLLNIKSPEHTFTNWCKKHWEENNIFAPPMDADTALRFLTDYLLGEDWYSVNPISKEQINTEIVHEILSRYSKAYKQERKNLIK